jgi:hypothetical protein
MTKYAAFGTVLNMGTAQVETAIAVGTITVSGDATATVTAAGMTGSPLAITVAVLENDTADTWAEKVRVAMLAESDLTDLFDVGGSGNQIILTRIVAAANDATLNIALADDTSSGISDDATSDNTTTGVALGAVANVMNISGPGLSLDTEDVTTHDSTAGWEEHVSTILRSGEVSLDVVFDPNDATHDGADGLASALDGLSLRDFSMAFPGSVTWYFDAFVNAFEPSMDVDGALTASVTLKITGAPIIT